jgi:hypothetical protein
LTGHKRDSSKKSLILRLTPEQKGLIQQCTGRVLDTLDLEEYGDRLTMSRLGEPVVSPDKTDNKVLIVELTGEQKRQVRQLTGKVFSQLRIQRRQN